MQLQKNNKINYSHRVAAIAHDPRWGGGVHPKHLAELLRLGANSREFRIACAIAYRAKKIDFCGDYIVAPAPRRAP